jgi:aspartate racemase
MRTLGLLGGMSWESTLPYYRYINEGVRDRLGGLHSARLLLYSFEFHEIARLMRAAEWDEAGERLAAAAVLLERAGAEALVLTSNTLHKVAPRIVDAITVPFLHIADATADAARAAGAGTVGLLGTRFTMEEDFYVEHLRARHGLEVLVPDPGERVEIDRIIFDELCRGRILDPSRETFRRAVGALVARGARGIVLGCTEIALLLDPDRLPVAGFDTARLHAARAVEFALGGPAEDGRA